MSTAPQVDRNSLKKQDLNFFRQHDVSAVTTGVVSFLNKVVPALENIEPFMAQRSPRNTQGHRTVGAAAALQAYFYCLCWLMFCVDVRPPASSQLTIEADEVRRRP